MKFEIKYNYPIDEDVWNKLCEQCDNFVQSTYNDKAQSFYQQVPVYFHLLNEGNSLVAGVKFYYSENKRTVFKPFSKTVYQFGEMIYSDGSNIDIYKKILFEKLSNFLKQKKIVTYVCGNFYGNSDLLIKLNNPFVKNKISYFNVAYVDLHEKDLLATFNRNTRRNIKKAEEADLKTIIDNKNINDFMPLLVEVYEQQGNPEGCPNLDYIKNFYESLSNCTILTYCFQEKQLLSAVLNIKFGKSVYSLFGGTLKNDIGSGQYMYYQLMKDLQQKGFQRYYFGQIAREEDEKNKKFSIGISTFKRGFTCDEVPSEKNEYILKPFYHRFWQVLIKLRKTW